MTSQDESAAGMAVEAVEEAEMVVEESQRNTSELPADEPAPEAAAVEEMLETESMDLDDSTDGAEGDAQFEAGVEDSVGETQSEAEAPLASGTSEFPTEIELEKTPIPSPTIPMRFSVPALLPCS